MYPRARNPCTKALVTGSMGSGPAITERGAVLKKYPTRYTLIACCALAASGHVVAAPPIRPRNSRRLMSAPKTQDKASYPVKLAYRKGSTDVCFGSKADMCSARRHVRFSPNSDRESGLRQPVMSALPPKPDSFYRNPYGPMIARNFRL